MNRDTVNMIRYKILAKRSRYEKTERDVKKRKVAEAIDPALQNMISELKRFDAERLNLIKTLAIGLTKWIEKEDGSLGDEKVYASERILICYLAQLEGKTDETAITLGLSSLGLKSLPPEIGKLTKLRILSLSYGYLTSVPEELGNLTKLEELYLSENQITSVEVIGNLRNLEVLHLENNKLEKLPEGIGNLRNLEVLNFSHNQLTSVEGIGNLRNLEVLHLENNKLKKLPEEIGQLTKLKELYLSHNQLRELPAEFGQLINLYNLNLDNNQLTSLEGIGNLTNLEWLYLSHNQLRELPAEFGQLTNMEKLNLANNYLTETETEKLPVGTILGYQKGKKEWQKDIKEISKCQQSNIATLMGKREVTGKSLFLNSELASLLHLIRIGEVRGWEYV